MAKLAPIFAPRVAEDVIAPLTEEEAAIATLQRHLPGVLNDVVMLVGKPVQLHFDPTETTARTDCRAHVWINPAFFLEGRERIGTGVAYHEGGHIRWSPYAGELIERARRESGEVRGHIMNIILDRKDDMLTCDFAPGFAATLRDRLTYICTATLQAALRLRFPSMDAKVIERMATKIRPSDPYEDFFFACKWHRRPQTLQAAKAMKAIPRSRLLTAKPEELLQIAETVERHLGPRKKSDEKRSKTPSQGEILRQLLLIATKVEGKSRRFTPAQGLAQLAMQKAIGILLSGQRHRSLQQMIRLMTARSMRHPGPISVGRVHKVPVEDVRPNAKNRSVYEDYRRAITGHIQSLIRRLRMLETPVITTLHGQDEGDLDLTETARIAIGLTTGIYEQEVVIRSIDAEIGLAIDSSGSMSGDKVELAKQIVVLFSEAMMAMTGKCDGWIWGYHSQRIFSFGRPSRDSGFVHLEGAAVNSDTHLLELAGNHLGQSRRRQRVLILICDDGPDDIGKARELSQQLMARGILVIAILVEVHASPNIYPIELLFESFETCLPEFGTILETVLRHLQ